MLFPCKLGVVRGSVSLNSGEVGEEGGCITLIECHENQTKSRKSQKNKNSLEKKPDSFDILKLHSAILTV